MSQGWNSTSVYPAEVRRSQPFLNALSLVPGGTDLLPDHRCDASSVQRGSYWQAPKDLERRGQGYYRESWTYAVGSRSPEQGAPHGVRVCHEASLLDLIGFFSPP